MWIIYRTPSQFQTDLDSNVVGIVDDKEIDAFQSKLAERINSTIYPLIDEVMYLQPFVGTWYYARRYEPMTQYTKIHVPRERLKVETTRASLFRDVELQSPCSSGQ